jgi:hypothetical protein
MGEMERKYLEKGGRGKKAKENMKYDFIRMF